MLPIDIPAAHECGTKEPRHSEKLTYGVLPRERSFEVFVRYVHPLFFVSSARAGQGPWNRNGDFSDINIMPKMEKVNDPNALPQS